VHDGDSDLYNSDSDNDEVSTKQQEGLLMLEGARDGTGGDAEAKTRDDKPGSDGKDEEDEDADVDPKELKRWHQLKAEEAVCDSRKVSHVLRLPTGLNSNQYQPKKKTDATRDIQLTFKKGVREVDGKERADEYCRFCL